VLARYLADDEDNSRKLLHAKHQITYNTNSKHAFKTTTKANIFSKNYLSVIPGNKKINFEEEKS